MVSEQEGEGKGSPMSLGICGYFQPFDVGLVLRYVFQVEREIDDVQGEVDTQANDYVQESLGTQGRSCE